MNRIRIQIALGLMALLAGAPTLWGQNSSPGSRRARNEGFYRCENSNTTGKGSIWASVRATGFLWDDPSEGQISAVPFLDAEVNAGLLRFMSASLKSRLVSYFFDQRPQFGDLELGIKATVPNNKDLRYNGFALSLKYARSFKNQFKSIGGLRNDKGFGFSPEGFEFGGNSLFGRLMFERDYIAQNSRIPLKLMINFGTRLSLDPDFFAYPQYSFDIGLGYVGNMADFFAAYSLSGFYNNSLRPKQVSFELPSGAKPVWEIAFPENPMYVVFGGRVRYGTGITLSGYVPLLLSSNVGSSRTKQGLHEFYNMKSNPDPAYRYYEEVMRGVTEPFDPWYARWKIIVELKIPVRYRQTASEMRRSFLLLKMRGDDRKIDIDERLKKIHERARERTKEETGTQPEQEVEEERLRRLEEIRRKREEIQKQ